MTHPFENTTAQPSSGAVDDAFFVLRDTRALLEQRLRELATRAGVGSKAVVEAFVHAVGEAHDELANDKQRDGFESTEGLTASRITLMCDADLELDIRIKEIARKLAEHAGNALWRAQLRYMTLLQRPAMSPESNPVGAEAIASGLWALCNASGSALDRQLELLDRLDELLTTELPAVYDELNDLMAARNIEPAQSTITQTPGARIASPAAGTPMGGTVTYGGGSGGGGGDPFAALQQALSAQFGGPAAGMAGMPAIAGGGGGLGPMTGAVGGSAANVALNAATLVMLNQLSARLEQMQWTGGGTANPGAAPVPGNDSGVAGGAASGAVPGVAADAMPASGVPKAIKAADLDLPLGNPESIALETLGHIFEAIFETWDLPDTVKTAIGRLQIPLLRLSLFDQTLFSNNQHPARQLINAMGRAAIGLPRDISRSDPVSKRLWKIAGTVQEALQGDAAVLAEPLEQIRTLIAERDAVIQETATPFVEHLESVEAQARSGEAVRRWLTDVAQQPSAREIHDFLRQHWVRVMEAAAREGGEAGTAWKEAEETAADLLWSVQPKADADERKRLATLVATLIRRINGGLDRIGVTQEERAPFLDACFNLQTASLRGSPPPMVTVAAPVAAADAGGAAGSPLVITESLVGSQPLRVYGRADGSAPAYRAASNILQAGQWLQTAPAEGDPLTGLVTWIHPKNGTALLCNPDWGFALALTAEAIDHLRRQGKLSVLSARAIFDEAADRAFRQLAGNA